MVRISKDLDESIEGEDVMLVEDIIDTGFTTRYLLQHLSGRGAEIAGGVHAAGSDAAADRANSAGLPLL